MIYLGCFAISALFAYFASKTENKYRFYTFSAISIAVVVLLAGLRDATVGIDTGNYLTKNLYWDGAIKSATFVDYFYEYIISDYGEPLFALIIGIIAQTTGDFNFFLIITHLMIITCVYIGAFRFKKYARPELVLLVFYLFFFNHSLNVMRQYVAMALVFVFLPDLLEKKYIKFSIAVLVASLFHTSALVAFGFLLLYIIIYAPIKIGTPLNRKIAVSALLACGVLGFYPLAKIAIKFGVINKRYMFLFESSKIEPAVIIIAIAVLGLAAAFYFRNKLKEMEYSDYFVMCSVCYAILLLLTFTVSSSKRIGLYFGMADLVTLGVIQKVQTEKKMKILVYLGIIGVALCYWVYVYALRNASGTLPYNLMEFNF